MKRPLIKFLSLLLSLAIAFPLPAFAGSKECEGKLAVPAVDAEPEPQDLLSQLIELEGAIKNKLGATGDPFIAYGAYDPNMAFKLMDSLSFDNPNSDNKQPSVVGQVRSFLFDSHEMDETRKSQVEDLGHSISQYAKVALHSDTLNKGQLYRAYTAIDLYKSLYYQFQPKPEVDRDGEPIDQPEKKEEQKQQDKQEEEPTEEEEPNLQEFPKDYDPHTKDTDQQGGSDKKRKPFAHITFRGKTAYFAQRRYNVVKRNRSRKDRFQSAPIPFINQQLPTKSSNVKKMIVHVPKDRIGISFDLFFPPGLMPVQSTSPDYQVQMNEDGTYSVTAKIEKFEMEMTAEMSDLNPMQNEFLRAPVGIDESEWPERMSNELFPLLNKNSPQRAAQLIEGFIRNRYLYSVDAKDESDPIAALNKGAFQCDMAALIMVALLRDHLKIPARAVGGLRAKAGPDQTSVAFTPGEGHAWVEVYVNGRWETFDPTPKIKDRAKKEESDPNGSADRQKDFDDDTFQTEFEDPNEQDDSQGKKSDSDNQKTSKSKKDKDKKDGKESDEKSDKKPKQEGKDSKKDKNASVQDSENSDKMSDEEKAAIQDQLERDLTVGSLSLQKNQKSTHLVERAVRVILRDAFSPKFPSQWAYGKISTLKTENRLKYTAIKELLARAEEAVKFKQEPVSDALLSISAQLRKIDVTKSRAKVVQVADRLRFFLELSDPKQRTPTLIKLTQLVEKVIRDFDRFAKVDGEKISVVKKFATGLPPHARRIFLEKFKIDNIDTSSGVKAAYDAISKGQLQHLNLMRILYPLTNFVIDSEMAPSYAMVTNHEESKRSKAPPVYTPLDSLRDAQYAIRGQPEKDIVSNLMAGTLYRRVRRRQIPIRRSGGFQDPYRVTIGLYDTSGSMAGDPGDFQAALLATFTDRALSEVGPSGEHRHLVQLMGFNSDVHAVKAVKNSAEARDIIQNYRETLKNTNGGTNIQAALKQAFAAILDAQKRAGEPLASANIVLMSDGGSTVNIDEIKKWRNAIDRKTPVKILFVGINGTNPDLIKLTEDIKDAGVNEAYYHEFSTEDISEYLKETKEIPQIDKRYDYHSDVRPTELPNQMIHDLDEASSMARSFVAEYENNIKMTSHEHWIAQLKSTTYRPHDDSKKSQYLIDIQNLKEYFYETKSASDRRTSTILLDDLFRNFKSLTGRDLSALDVKELESTLNTIYALINKLPARN